MKKQMHWYPQFCIVPLNEEDIDLNNEINAEYLNLGVVTSPNTIIENIYKLEPGTLIKFFIQKHNQYVQKFMNPASFVDRKKFGVNIIYLLLTLTVSDVPCPIRY